MCGHIGNLDCVKQEKPGKEHDRTGYTVNGERGRLTAAGGEDVGHIAKGDKCEDEEEQSHCPVIGGDHESQHGESGGDVADPFQAEPCEGVGGGSRRLEAKARGRCAAGQRCRRLR